MVEEEECAVLEVEVFCAGDGDAEPGAAEEAEEGSEEGPDEVAFEVWLGWGRKEWAGSRPDNFADSRNQKKS